MRQAIITGGSRGLGEALAIELIGKGYSVLDLSRTAPHAYSKRIDLAHPEVAKRALQEALSAIRPNDCSELVLVSNAAALAPMGPVWRKGFGEILENLNTNISSAVLIIGEVMRRFRGAACRKVIVNISSGAALKGYAGWSLYCAGKAAMESFIRAVAAEEAHEALPFTAISVDPGVMDTAMQAHIRQAAPADFPEVERFIRRKVAGDLVPPSQVAMAILEVLSRPGLVGGQRYDAPLPLR